MRNFQRSTFDEAGSAAGAARVQDLLALHILVWPAMAMGVLVLLCVALAGDFRAACRKGTGLA